MDVLPTALWLIFWIINHISQIYLKKSYANPIELGSWKFHRVLSQRVEEVSMKWMDRPCVTEMDRGGV